MLTDLEPVDLAREPDRTIDGGGFFGALGGVLRDVAGDVLVCDAVEFCGYVDGLDVELVTPDERQRRVLAVRVRYGYRDFAGGFSDRLFEQGGGCPCWWRLIG